MASDVSDISNMREISEITVNTPYIFWFETFVRNSYMLWTGTLVLHFLLTSFSKSEILYFSPRDITKKIFGKTFKVTMPRNFAPKIVTKSIFKQFVTR